VQDTRKGWRRGRERKEGQEERRTQPVSLHLSAFFSRAPNPPTSIALIGQYFTGVHLDRLVWRRAAACRNHLRPGSGAMQGGPLSPDEYRAASPPPPPLPHQAAPTIVVAIDRDRNSQLAAKWVVDHLLSSASHIILLHVAAHHHRRRTSTLSLDAAAAELVCVVDGLRRWIFHGGDDAWLAGG